MNNIQKVINALLGLGLVVVLALSLNGAPKFGGASGAEYFPTQWVNGLSAGKLKQLTVDSSGNLAIVNTVATSTLAAGCLGLNATSSATTEKLVFVATTTLGTSGIGYFVPVYGTCP